MSDLHELLDDPTPDVDLPNLDDLWAKGRKQRRNRSLGRGAVAAAMVGLLGIGGVQLAGSNDQQTSVAEVADQRGGIESVLPAGTAVDSVANTNGPQVGDHWHNAFGIYICGEFLADIQSDLDPVGIHTHNDGLIHIHPFSSAAAGDNATLGLFAESLEIDDDLDAWSQRSCTDGEDNDVPSEFKVVRWESVTAQDPAETVVDDYRSVKLVGDGQVIMVALVAQGEAVPMPPSVTALRAAIGAPVLDPPSVVTFCHWFGQLGSDVAEHYIGSTQHVTEIETLLALAPDELRVDLGTYLDFLRSGAIDPATDPESTTVGNWPPEVQVAIANIQRRTNEIC